MKVVVVGGSLSGLMYGIVFSRAGHNVIILERNTTYSAQTGQGAGIQFGPHLSAFLEKYDKTDDSDAFTLPSEHVQELTTDGSVKRVIPRPGHNISWGNLYERLRHNYDGSAALSTESAEYRTGVNVTNVEQRGKEWILTWSEESSESFLTADLVVAADGAFSKTRVALSRITQDASTSSALVPQYMGCVAWRGTVPDTQVSPEAMKIFEGKTSIFRHPDGYILCYYIPGPPTADNENGTKPGSRLLNFVWYTNQTRASLDEILTDKDGHRHRRSIAPGQIQPSIWAEQRDYAIKTFPKFFAEIVAAVEQPFIQAIDELIAPTPYITGVASHTLSEATSTDVDADVPRALLVGEAYTVLRPNTAQGTNMIAGSALSFANVCAEQKSENEWASEYQYQVGMQGRIASAYGEFFINGVALSTAAAVTRSAWFYASSIAVEKFWSLLKPARLIVNL